MSLTRLLIKDFRNIESADLALSPGFNFLVGANGSGKTSVLEAIYTLGHGRAFRSLQIGRVIRHEQDAFVLHGRLQGEERETAIGLTKDKQGDSKVRIDGTDGHKVAELALGEYFSGIVEQHRQQAELNWCEMHLFLTPVNHAGG